MLEGHPDGTFTNDEGTTYPAHRSLWHAEKLVGFLSLAGFNRVEPLEYWAPAYPTNSEHSDYSKTSTSEAPSRTKGFVSVPWEHTEATRGRVERSLRNDPRNQVE